MQKFAKFIENLKNFQILANKFANLSSSKAGKLKFKNFRKIMIFMILGEIFTLDHLASRN